MAKLEREIQNLNKALESGIRQRVSVTLSPEMVDYLIGENSIVNRKASNSRIAKLALSIEKKGYIAADDFKFYDGHLINGQHRLMALRRLYKDEWKDVTEYPIQEILVNLSEDEARLIDTAQARSLKQRIAVGFGIDYPAGCVAAVRFSLAYRDNFLNSVMLDDDKVAELLASESWQAMFQDLNPSYELRDSIKRTHIGAPAYAAIKEFRDRVKKPMWKKFLDEFTCNVDPTPMVRKLHSLLEMGPTEAREKFGSGSGTAQQVFYRLTVCILKAYEKGRKNLTPKPCDWEN